MGFSHKSHGKKSDKETQSPMLKIFKDIMQKEKQDPEKTTLLREKHERKRRHYSGSRSKAGHKITESSSSEKIKSSYNQGQDIEYENSRSQSLPFQGDKRESWWFWRDAAPRDTVTGSDDTCSCVSCALKKIITTDYACVACLVILFVVSVAAGLMLLYKSVPCSDHPTVAPRMVPTRKFKSEGDRLKRKIDTDWNFQDTNSWSKIYSNTYEPPPMDSMNFQDISILAEPLGDAARALYTSNNMVLSDSDLARMLDAEQLNHLQDNVKLREFYKKLLQTDLAIRGLKKAVMYNNFDTDLSYLENQDRAKRSIKLFQRPLKLFHLKRRDQETKPRISNGKLHSKTTVNMTKKRPLRAQRNKRFESNNYSVPDSFMIEKNTVVIQYQPNPNRIVAKCSHAPKDSKSHETELKHPFYKNTQRLDELLDQFLDKKVPDVMSDQFSLDLMTGKEQDSKTGNNDDIVLVTEPYKDNNEQVTVKDDKEEVKDESKFVTTENAFENEFFDDSEGVETSVSENSTYDILLSISTIINPVRQDNKRSTQTTPLPSPAPNRRKLMEADVKEDETIGYEDFKEVLNDDKEAHDESDRDTDRKKRCDQINEMEAKINKYHNPGVNNPNWKGPMPLYPEELNAMAKSNTDTKKYMVPINNKDIASERDEAELDTNDVVYVEDYVDNSYEKLAKLAQAYSDYGVFDEKKELYSEKKVDKANQNKVDDGRMKLSIDRFKNRLRKSGIFSQNKEKPVKEPAMISSNGEAHDSFPPSNLRRHREGPKEQITIQHRDLGAEIHGSPHSDTGSEGIRIEFHPGNHGKDLDQSDLFRILQKHIRFTGSEPHDSHKGIIEKDHENVKLNGFMPILTTSYPDPSELPVVLNRLGIQKKNNKEPNDFLFNMNNRRSLKSLEYKDSNVYENTNRVPNDEDNIGEPSVIKVKRYTANNTLEKLGNFTHQNSEDGDKTRADDTEPKTKRGNQPINEELEDDNTTLKRRADNVTLEGKSTSKGNISMSDFFSMLANWFSALDGSDFSKKTTIAKESKPEKTPLYEVKLVTEPTYPLYDSDMIENIGHRSRVLLSIEDENTTVQADDSKSDPFYEQDADTSTESMMEDNSTQLMANTQYNVENSTTKRKIKRQALDDSSLIFWGDLYDEEYGVDIDPSENTVGDKRTANRNDLFKKSNIWLQNKVKTISDRFGRNFKNVNQFPDLKKINGDADSFSAENILKRSRRFAHDRDKPDFAMLTARMKEVCRNTVREVENTKSKEVRQDNKADQQATSLMQQLVQLMAELVDFQVQERTCKKLPPDLQQFLIWLTSSKADAVDPPIASFDIDHPEDKLTEQEFQLPPEGVKENMDPRSDCLGTIHAVQDLMRQYEEMSEDDKSAMVGVKDYLTHQMDFLEHRLASISDSSIYNNEVFRYRRELVTDAVHHVTEIAYTIKEIAENTAHTIGCEYKKLNKAIKKYRKKFKHVMKEIKSTTEKIQEKTHSALEEVQKVIRPKPKKPKEKSKVSLKEKSKQVNKEFKSHEHLYLKKGDGKHPDLKNGPHDKIVKGNKASHETKTANKQDSGKDRESIHRANNNEIKSQGDSGGNSGLKDARKNSALKAKDGTKNDGKNIDKNISTKVKNTKVTNAKNKGKHTQGIMDHGRDEIFNFE